MARNSARMLRMLLCVSVAVMLVATMAAGAGAAKKTLKLYSFSWPTEKAASEKAAAGFMKLHPDVDVKIEYPQKYDLATLGAELITGTIGDVLYIPGWDTLWMGNLSSRGAFLQLDKYLAKDPSFKKSNYPAMAISTFSRGDKLYGLPIGVDSVLIQYNTKMYADAGIPSPKKYLEQNNWTWDTFRDAAKKLTKRDSSGKLLVGGYIMDTSWVWASYWSYSNGVFSYFSEDFKKNYFDDPKVIEAMQFVQDVLYKDKSAPDPFATFDVNIWYWFRNGKLAMNRATSQQAGEKYPDVEFDVTIMPKKTQYATMGYAMGVGVTSKTKEPELAVQFAQYLADSFADQTIQDAYMMPASKVKMAEFLQKHPGKDGPALTRSFETAHPFQMDLAYHPDWDTNYAAWATDIKRNIGPILDKWARNQETAKEAFTKAAAEIRSYVAKNIK